MMIARPAAAPRVTEPVGFGAVFPTAAQWIADPGNSRA